MELSQEHLDLIKRIVESDKKFQSNEDLFDDFFNETCKRALSIIETMDDTQSLESYLRKVASTSIVMVLKDMGRIRRSHQNYVATNEIKAGSITNDKQVLDKCDITYDFISLKSNPEEITIKKEILQSVYDSVIIAHSQNIQKQYLQLFELRYVDGKKQSAIAEEMNISQSQVSKRLFELMEVVKNAVK